MGCDIHIWAERKTSDGYEVIKGAKFCEGVAPFGWRAYGMYGFLAGVRNYSAIAPISKPRGFPENASGEVRSDFDDRAGHGHTASWLSVAELDAVDYEQTVEDRRTSKQIAHNRWNGAHTAAPGEGKETTLREFLGEAFIDDLRTLKECNADRVVFWFDN